MGTVNTLTPLVAYTQSETTDSESSAMGLQLEKELLTNLKEDLSLSTSSSDSDSIVPNTASQIQGD